MSGTNGEQHDQRLKDGMDGTTRKIGSGRYRVEKYCKEVI